MFLLKNLLVDRFDRNFLEMNTVVCVEEFCIDEGPSEEGLKLGDLVVDVLVKGYSNAKLCTLLKKIEDLLDMGDIRWAEI